ncbi:MAG: radical SAM protein [Thermodesulfobacteriota bacterium]
MKRNKMIQAAAAVAQAKLLKRNRPLVVGWAITHQCNRKCAYCAIWQRPRQDLPTATVFRIVDELAASGTLRISFTGGEPLLREDMGDIIRYVREKGIETRLNSNGSLVKEKIDNLRGLDMLLLSLEGPEAIHDAIRGPGSFQEVREAMRAARGQGVPVGLATVLASTNLDAVEFVLDGARDAGCRVMFQPATRLRLGGRAPNELAPPVGPYREVITGLIARKNAGDPAIANSLTGLRHLIRWPDPVRMACASGRISCRIEPDGQVLHCSRGAAGATPGNCAEASFREAFERLGPMACDDCWCAGRVELNLAFSFSVPTILNQLKTLVR